MQQIKYFIFLCAVFLTSNSFAQQTDAKKVKVSGKVLDKITSQPLEYTTITFVEVGNPSAVSGGITDAKGEFNFDVKTGVYNIKIEFISFKPVEIKID